MTEPSNYRVGPPPTAAMSPLKALGGMLVFVGMWLLFMGGSEYYGASTTQSMYNGTALEHNADIDRMMTNTMSRGATNIGFGIVALLLGGVMAAAGNKPGSTEATPTLVSTPQMSLNRKLTVRGTVLAIVALLGVLAIGLVYLGRG